jgi:hypothetical protein
LQVVPVPQIPQLTGWPQLLKTVPHDRPAQVVADDWGVQPHTLAAPPPPHVCGALQDPQFTVPLHPSLIVPQFFPAAAHVAAADSGVQEQVPKVQTARVPAHWLPQVPQLAGSVWVLTQVPPQSV